MKTLVLTSLSILLATGAYAETTENTENGENTSKFTLSDVIENPFASSQGTSTGSSTSDGPKFKFTPAGRILVDGAAYAPNNDGFASGFALPDIRIGGKASYGNWSAKIDLGFGYGKLSLKDVYLQYSFSGTNNYLRAGYFVHQYGLNAATSSSFKPSGEAPLSDNFFAATGRNIGIMFVLDLPKYFMGVSGIMGGGYESTDNYGRNSFAALGRFVWRPITTDGVVQIGVSPWIASPLYNHEKGDHGHVELTGKYFKFSTNFPTRVSKVAMMGATIDDARSLFKLTPELVLSYGRFALESQYYWMNVSRQHDKKSYSANGVYGLLRTLILGDSSYGYSHGDAGLALPKPKTLEMVLGYNYTDGNRHGINGGIVNDYSVTFNYYINKYMIARLAWHYSDVRNSAVMFDRHVNIIQARLQFKF